MEDVDSIELPSYPCLLNFKGSIEPSSYSYLVLFTPTWFTPGVVTAKYLSIPFDVQIKGLDFLSTDIGVTEYGIKL
ncbi:hypothetical protein AMTR_s00091p00022630 [Amborella trichopoda]|uniref:Uncharacterized protein n=1 Tax=Amborella trichopoda TaxID=13333 RepID=W1NZ35_AMBTC|nr:hypothetical protein AMTR_s00091p00022630 [Amborella trichopoda]